MNSWTKGFKACIFNIDTIRYITTYICSTGDISKPLFTLSLVYIQYAEVVKLSNHCSLTLVKTVENPRRAHSLLDAKPRIRRFTTYSISLPRSLLSYKKTVSSHLSAGSVVCVTG